MEYLYLLRTDIIEDTENGKVKVFGVTVADTKGNVLESVGDIFFDIDSALDFIKLCNSMQLDYMHLFYVIDDILS